MKQILHVTLVNLRSLPARAGPALVMLVGVAGVVGVLVSIVALRAAWHGPYHAAGDPHRAFVLSKEARTPAQSSLSVEHQHAVTQAPGLRRLPDGKGLTAIDARMSVALLGARDGFEKGVIVRGVAPEYWVMRPDIRIAAGRMFEPGRHEVIVGRAGQPQFQDTQLGDVILVDKVPLTVVGVFESGDRYDESRIMMDANAMMTLLKRTWVNVVVAELEDAAEFTSFKAALEAHGALEFNVVRETDYYVELSEYATRTVGPVFDLVLVTMMLAGVCCAANLLYATVRARAVEIATWWALGFNAASVVASVVVEALIVTLSGALLGALVVWLLFDGAVTTATDGYGSLITELDVGFDVLAESVALAMSIALLAALVPAVQAGRLSVTVALRQV